MIRTAVRVAGLGALLAAGLMLAGCDQSSPTTSEPVPAPNQEPPPEAQPEGADQQNTRLDEILAAQPREIQQRYPYRQPKETLAFFGIEPGMTVVEALPGGGWYTRILVPYLGSEGRLIGANYPEAMWPNFEFADEAFLESIKTWPSDWPEEARQWQGEDGARIDAFVFGSLPEEMEGQADAVLFIRALHNLARFEDQGGFLTTALQDAYDVLRPGGIVGIIQHEARPDMPDDWADGSAGYLKKRFVVDRMTEAGFELVEESDLHENPNDQPTTEDVVWRLPPSYRGADDPQRRAEVDAIGESNRMTLKFRKPE